MDAVVALSGRALTPAVLDAIARSGTQVSIVDDALVRIRAAHQTVERAVAAGAAIYGVTTGLGPRVVMPLDPSGEGEPSLRTLRARAVAVGDPLRREVVRAAMVARLNGLCTGGSGASPGAVETLAAMLNAGIHPIVPRHGSIGAADLCLLAHIGLVVAGEGEAEVDGQRMTGAEALRTAGLTPARLRLKDGLALCSASSVSAGAGALELVRGRRLLDALQGAAALSMEGFRANLSPIDPRTVAAHRAPGQEWAAAGLRELLAGGSLTQPNAARRLQDPISFRCVGLIHGALHAALEWLEAAIEPELNGASDNALVLADDDLIVSNGNFHTPMLALAADTVAIAIAQVAAPSAERIGRLFNAALSDLPANLSVGPTGSAGMAPLQKPAHALVSSIRHAATPYSIDPSVSAEAVEDDATNATHAVLRLTGQLDLLTQLIAIEMVCAAQAVDLAGPIGLGAGTGELYQHVRAQVEPLHQDRALGADIARVAGEIA